jgi:hypothetical protein
MQPILILSLSPLFYQYLAGRKINISGIALFIVLFTLPAIGPEADGDTEWGCGGVENGRSSR